MNKKTLSERDICTKFITSALEKSGWDKQLQILEEVSFTDGKNTLEEKSQFRQKVDVNGVDVSVLISRELHFDQHGKPITTSLKDHTKEIIVAQVAS
jgi:type I site-specific restriction endonuclease